MCLKKAIRIAVVLMPTLEHAYFTVNLHLFSEYEVPGPL